MISFLRGCCSSKNNQSTEPNISKEHNDEKTNKFQGIVESLCCCFYPWERMTKKHIAEIRAQNDEEPPPKVFELQQFKRQQTWKSFRLSILHTGLVDYLTRCDEIICSLDESFGFQLRTLKHEVLLVQLRIRIRVSLSFEVSLSSFNENTRFDISVFRIYARCTFRFNHLSLDFQCLHLLVSAKPKISSSENDNYAPTSRSRNPRSTQFILLWVFHTEFVERYLTPCVAS